MTEKEMVDQIRRSAPEYGSQMEKAKRLLSVIDEVCAVKNWDLKKYFEVHPAEWWHLQETAGFVEPPGYVSRTGRRVSAD